MSRRRILCTFAGIVVAVSAIAAQRPAQLLPIDEAARHPDFFSFRAQLQAAVARHDVDAVVASISKDIKNSFGGDDGIDGFRRMWKPTDADSTLWAELGAVLALGGTFSGESAFTAPYTFSRWPDRFDSFDHVALIASDVRIREAPHADAAPITSLSFAIVRWRIRTVVPRRRAGPRCNWTARPAT
jgi:hypothetical protein